MVNEEVCQLIWGRNNCGWAAREAQGRAEGLIVLWDSDKFRCMSWWHMDGVVVLIGFWGSEEIKCCIVNVYAPCPLDERREPWDHINIIVHQNEDVCVCIGGILIQ